MHIAPWDLHPLVSLVQGHFYQRKLMALSNTALALPFFGRLFRGDRAEYRVDQLLAGFNPRRLSVVQTKLTGIAVGQPKAFEFPT
jgi:hypothetical protein